MTDKTTKRQVTAEYGKRCSVVQAGCPVCDAWTMFDKLGICPTTEQLRDFQAEGEGSMTTKTETKTETTTKRRYSHAYDFAFEVFSDHPEGGDVTPAMLREALLKRAISLDDMEMPEACGRWDTHEVTI